MKKTWLFGFFAVAIALPLSCQAVSVYLIGGNGDAEGLRNKPYIDILSDGITILNVDLEEVFVPGLGYDVTWVDAAGDEDPAVGATFDVVIASEMVNSGDVGQYIDLPVPYLAIEQVLAANRTDRDGGVYFTDQNSVSLPDGDFMVTITDNTHPITEIYEEGQEIEITQNLTNAQVSGILPDFLAPAARELARTGYIVGPERVCLAVADEGATGFDDLAQDLPPGAEPAPARRAFLGYHERVHIFDNAAAIEPADIAFTVDGIVLFQRVVQWMAGVPVTADGTEEGVRPPDVSVAEWSIQ